MSVTQLTTPELCQRLAEGWKPENAEVPRELLSRLSARWHANLELEESAGPSAYRAALVLDRIRLLGALDFGCLVLGAGASIEREVVEFWRQQGGIGRLALILAATPTIKEAVQRASSAAPCLILTDVEIAGLLTEPHPLEVLKRHLRQQIPIRRLMPYDFLHPAPPNMFFGRRDLLDRFHQETTTSFAMAGPGRIGKSSVLKQYHYELRLNRRDNRHDRQRFIDCYSYSGLRENELARRFALELSAGPEAYRVRRETFLKFLKWLSCAGRHPLELLLDEVDSICLSDTFQELGEAVRLSYCRVILCGKGNLHRMMRKKETPFAQRLELIQPEPLDEKSAQQLFVEPLSDLGFKLQDQSALCEGVLKLTSRLPNLIQACAKRMVECALNERCETITAAHLRRVREEFAAMSYATLPLDDMQDDLTRFVALLWLRAGGDIVTVGALQALAEQSGLSLEASKALDICHDLWICNVLTCERDTFALANPHLVHFVHRMDFNKEIARLSQALTSNSRVRVSVTT